MITSIQLFFSLAIIAVIAITIIIYVASKKYQQGFDDAKEKFNVIPDIIWDQDNLVHEGLAPTAGVHIYEKQKTAPNLVDIVPEFGIDLRYCPNEKPNQRKFHISIRSMYKLNPIEITPNGISDGYHTFDELYQYRLMYNAGLVNMITYTKSRYHDFHNPLDKITVYKSKKHNDGQNCFDGNWFIVVIETPWGQISNHYELKDWDKFNCKIIRKAHKYDGHTPQDCLERLNKLYSYLIKKVNKF